jgi:hypothetical protein
MFSELRSGDLNGLRMEDYRPLKFAGRSKNQKSRQSCWQLCRDFWFTLRDYLLA